MSSMDEIREWLRQMLPDLLAEHQVPGAVVAVGAGGETAEAAAGLLNTATGVEVTADSLFQIGSITKVLTATLVMQLVDEGKVELDAPVRAYLPTFDLAGGRITVRQLLCHVAGFEGDVFTDTGKGDDCLERYVATLGGVEQLFEPGEMFSYNNAGFCVLGRIVEVVRGEPFDACVRAHLFTPLGMTHAANDPYEAILHRVAVGHIKGAPTPVWAMARSNAPAGSMLAMRARDLLAFARMHLAGGLGVLSTASVTAMRRPQVTLPDIGWGTAWGLGWELFGRTAFGHQGSTIGQSALLRVAPERDTALVILTNGGNPEPVFREITRHVLGETEPPAPVPEPLVNASRYTGTYASSTGETTVSQDEEGRLWLEHVPLGVTADLDEFPYRTELLAWRGDSLRPAGPEGVPVAFLGDDGTGHAAYLHTGRATPMISSCGRTNAGGQVPRTRRTS
ncbi:serine hydrolase domain-containing protein [Nonomuraea sp. NPDC050556]|uniref:serine hydrolase domain-containing protein n=1 Tax=Nonomuraea sp. NPDC050556 TaxID=3364369 RepID=UPI00379F098F